MNVRTPTHGAALPRILPCMGAASRCPALLGGALLLAGCAGPMSSQRQPRAVLKPGEAAEAESEADALTSRPDFKQFRGPDQARMRRRPLPIFWPEQATQAQQH